MADVLNRTTKQLVASANTPDYPAQDWIISPDLSAVSGQPAKYWTISGDTVSLMDQAARDAVDAAELPALKEAKIAGIDARTDEIVSLGFEFGGKRFSLSQNAQIKWIGMVVGAAALPYPYPVPTLDGLDTLALANASEVQQLYAAAMTAVATIYGAAIPLKSAVAAATNADEVAAVEDDRG